MGKKISRGIDFEIVAGRPLAVNSGFELDGNRLQHFIDGQLRATVEGMDNIREYAVQWPALRDMLPKAD